jgi:hypothetical protein
MLHNVLVAYAQAAGMPMAVPVSCSQNVSPKENMLLDKLYNTQEMQLRDIEDLKATKLKIEDKEIKKTGYCRT